MSDYFVSISKENLVNVVRQLQREMASLKLQTIKGVQQLSELADSLGEHRSGQLAAITAADPTSVEANGAFFDADGVEFSDGQTYHVGGVHNGQLMFGLRAEDGAGVFAGGAGVIDADGIHLTGIRYAIEQTATDPEGNNPRSGRIEMVHGDNASMTPIWQMQFADAGMPTELVTNGDFETGDASGWSVTNATYGTIVAEADPQGGYRGKYAKTGAFNSDLRTNVFTVTQLKKYKVAVTCEVIAGTSPVFSCQIDFYASVDGSGARISGALISADYGTVVQKATHEKTVKAPAGANSARLLFYPAAGYSTTAYVDDVSVHELAFYTNIQLSAEGLSSSDGLFPENATWLMCEARTAAGADAWVDKNTGSNYHLSRVWGRLAANANNGDVYRLPSKLLTAGNYRVTLYGYRTTASAIVEIVVDEVVKASFDLYGTAADDTRWTSSTFELPISGLHTVTLRVNGHNASSSDYTVMLSMIEMYRVT